jgi:hypothetical protein
MPRFFISFLRGGLLSKDDEGLDLPGLEEAKTAAMVSAREILANDIKGASGVTLEAVIITNEDSQQLLTFPATDILPEALKR